MKCFSRCMLLYGGLIFFVAIVAGMEDDKDSIEKITDEENFYDAISDANLNVVDYELLTKYREKREKRQTKNRTKGNLTKYGSLSELHETVEPWQYVISTSLQINTISKKDAIAYPLLTINLVRHADKKKEDVEKYSKQEPNKNYEWELDGIKKPGGVMAAYFLGVHFYYKYENSKIPPLIYTSPFCRCIQTAIPIAKALNTKIKIEYGLFEPLHGFPTKEEIQFFYDGNEKYIDTEYESKYYKIFDFINSDGFMYELTQNENVKIYDKEKEKLKNLRYQNRKMMTEYFKNVQREERNDIIVVSHKEALRTIGNLLIDPESVVPSGHIYENDKNGSKEFKDMRKWEMGVIIPYHKKEDGNYEEDSTHYKSKELYKLLKTNKIEEFKKKFGQLEPDAYDYTKQKLF